MRGMYYKLAIAGCATLLILTGCAHHSDSGDNSKQPIIADAGYVTLDNLPADATSINPIRLDAIRQTATELGARGALAWRSLQINQSLATEALPLDHAFDFNQLLLPHNVCRPS